MYQKYIKYYNQYAGNTALAGARTTNPTTVFSFYFYYYPIVVSDPEYFEFNHAIARKPKAIDTIEPECFTTLSDSVLGVVDMNRNEIADTTLPEIIINFMRTIGVTITNNDLQNHYAVIITPCYYYDGQQKFSKSFLFNITNHNLFSKSTDRVFTNGFEDENLQKWIGYNNSQSDNKETISIFLIKIPDNDNKPRNIDELFERKEAYVNRFLTLFRNKYRIPESY